MRWLPNESPEQRTWRRYVVALVSALFLFSAVFFILAGSI